MEYINGRVKLNTNKKLVETDPVLTYTISAPKSQWKELRELLAEDSKHDIYQFFDVIDDALNNEEDL